MIAINSAFSNGGVIHSLQGTTNISNSLFVSNDASNNGGVVSAYQGSLSIFEDCSFSYNTASNDGGVIHAYGLTLAIRRKQLQQKQGME